MVHIALGQPEDMMQTQVGEKVNVVLWPTTNRVGCSQSLSHISSCIGRQWLREGCCNNGELYLVLWVFTVAIWEQALSPSAVNA